MSKTIRDQLATVQSMIDEALRGQPRHVDDFRALAALAETQLHLVRALEAKPMQAGRSGDRDDFDASRLFDLVNHKSVVDWPVDDWECPACGGERFLMIDALPPSQARPSKDLRWVLADIECRCHECEFESTAGLAAMSIQRERAGYSPAEPVLAWREPPLT